MILAAAILMAVIAAVHLFIGTRTDLAPLLASEVPEPPRSTLYMCWHLISILLFAMAAALALAAADERYQILGQAICVLSAAFGLWGIAAAAIRRKSLVTQLPQGMMFVAVAALSAASFA